MRVGVETLRCRWRLWTKIKPGKIKDTNVSTQLFTWYVYIQHSNIKFIDVLTSFLYFLIWTINPLLSLIKNLIIWPWAFILNMEMKWDWLLFLDDSWKTISTLSRGLLATRDDHRVNGFQRSKLKYILQYFCQLMLWRGYCLLAGGWGVLEECDFLFNFLLWRKQMILLNSGYWSHNWQILKEGTKFTSFETSKIKT